VDGRIILKWILKVLENWRILTNKEIYAVVQKSHYNRDNKVK
jgi:hypothetical protein